MYFVGEQEQDQEDDYEYSAGVHVGLTSLR